MKMSLKWLADYVDLTLSPQELAFRLTMAGTEVGGVHETGGAWDQVVVGRVAELKKHPNADRLLLATVDVGERQLTVVTGAPNLEPGQKVPFAYLGARLIDGHTGKPTTLKPRDMRGITSEGMVCSEKELGLSDDHTGIMVLPDDAPVGRPLREYLGDVILDLELTPNRPDCLGVVGVAREVAALTGQRVREPAIDYPEAGPPVETLARVAIADPDRCRRFTASVIQNVTIGPSPQWLQERLLAAGMRPINNVVDITNFVMLELGQPLHAYDYDKVAEHTLIARRARDGETLRTLDEEERQFISEDLLIADGRGPVGVAGIMGGGDSEISESTTTIFLEAANFNHISIRRTSARLRLRTEASSRFDKGLPPVLAEVGLRRATRLIVELAGGTAARGILDAYPTPQVMPTIDLTTAEVRRILGVDIPLGQQRSVLESLNFTVEPLPADAGLRVTPPYYRQDVRLTDDVIEELARISGYDAIPTTMIRGAIPTTPVPPVGPLEERLRALLVGCGMQEIITYPLVSAPLLEKVLGPGAAQDALKLANPLTTEQEYLRTSLRPSLLNTLAANQRHTDDGLRLFEIGKAYLKRPDDLPEERRRLIGGLMGPRTPRTWQGTAPNLDFFDAKGIVEELLDRLHIAAEFVPGQDAHLHPGKTATVRTLNGPGQVLGVIGELHPELRAAFELRAPVYLFELAIEALLTAGQQIPQYRPFSRFPAVEQDLALVVGLDAPAAAIERVLRAAPLVVDVRLFDVYTGDQVPPGKKSLAYALTYQAPDRTLTDRDVERVQDNLLKRLGKEFGATLRT